MDPLSIVASTLAIVAFCDRVVSIFQEWKDAKKVSDRKLSRFMEKVTALHNILMDTRRTFERPDLLAIIENDQRHGRVWPDIPGVLEGCKATMRAVLGIFRRFKNRRTIQLATYSEEMEVLSRRLRICYDSLRIALNQTSIVLTLHQIAISSDNQAERRRLSEFNARIREEVQQLSRDISTTRPSARSDSSVREADEFGRNMSHYIASTQIFIQNSNATIEAPLDPDDFQNWRSQQDRPTPSDYAQTPRGRPSQDRYGEMYQVSKAARASTGSSSSGIHPSRADLKSEDQTQSANQSRRNFRTASATFEHIKSLEWIVKHGEHSMLMDLLEVTSFSLSQKTRMLHLAISHGHRDVVKTLLENEAVIDGEDGCGRTPLQAAIREKSSRPSIAQLLIEYGANVSIGSPLHWAARRNWPTIIEMLWVRGVDIDRSDSISGMGLEGITALHVAAYYDSLDAARILIREGAAAEIKTPSGELALAEAISNASIPMIDLLLSSGIHIDAAIDSHGGTPLMAAACLGNIALVECLIKHGAAINATDHDHDTALHIAAVWGNEAVVSALLRRGARVNLSNSRGETPLSLALLHQKPLPIIDLLLRSGAKRSSVSDSSLDCAIQDAEYNGDFSVIDLLHQYFNFPGSSRHRSRSRSSHWSEFPSSSTVPRRRSRSSYTNRFARARQSPSPARSQSRGRSPSISFSFRSNTPVFDSPREFEPRLGYRSRSRSSSSSGIARPQTPIRRAGRMRPLRRQNPSYVASQNWGCGKWASFHDDDLVLELNFDDDQWPQGDEYMSLKSRGGLKTSFLYEIDGNSSRISLSM